MVRWPMARDSTTQVSGTVVTVAACAAGAILITVQTLRRAADGGDSHAPTLREPRLF